MQPSVDTAGSQPVDPSHPLSVYSFIQNGCLRASGLGQPLVPESLHFKITNIRAIGRHYGTRGKPPFEMLTPRIKVSGFKPQLCSPPQLPANADSQDRGTGSRTQFAVPHMGQPDAFPGFTLV